MQAFLQPLQKVIGRIYNSIFMTSVEAFEEGAFMPRSPRELLFNNEPLPILWSIANLEGIHGLHGRYILKYILII